ncbi:hypothetical protein K438DRAFT_1993952 [Mycena galopus ATCC 62051]|nr:hypothetical protein K438DRAFT_1993952 [Mycena galopus ATCC 62051]
MTLWKSEQELQELRIQDSIPPQNLVDLAWKDKEPKSKEPLFEQPIEFTGEDTVSKIHQLREWIRRQPPSVPAYSKTPPTESQIHVGTLITNLASIVVFVTDSLSSQSGSDIPFNPLFQAYLFVPVDDAILFVDRSKCNDGIMAYLDSFGVRQRGYVDLWQFLRRRDWGQGKLASVRTARPLTYPCVADMPGQWGIRIESALAVVRVRTRNEFNGPIWLGFERLTCVPIQTRMVKDGMLTKEEKQWLKDHNQRCYQILAPLLKEDKRASKWLKRETDRGIGIATGPGGMSIDWRFRVAPVSCSFTNSL